MKLYHVSTKATTQSVRERGLIPGNAETGSFGEFTSPNNLVYMSSFINLPYVLRQAGETAHVFEVETERLLQANLCPDDEQLAEQFLRVKQPDLDSSSDAGRGAIYALRDKLDMRTFNALWQTFVATTGTCAHIGVISADAIERNADFPIESLRTILKAVCDRILDPKISAGETRLLADHITSAIMNDVEMDVGLSLGLNAPNERVVAAARSAIGEVVVRTWRPPFKPAT